MLILAGLACLSGGTVLLLVYLWRTSRDGGPPGAAPPPTAGGDYAENGRRPGVRQLPRELEGKSRAELFCAANGRSIPRTFTMSKDELIEAILTTESSPLATPGPIAIRRR
jgi:hypothetical protein